MPFNDKIPGQINRWQMRAIEIIATAIPRNGHVVEVGSLFGASSWAWAKSVDPTVTIHCVDPWERNKGVQPIEERYGITYSLEQFQEFVSDCNNIQAHKGYSPVDFEDWDLAIDLYYEDAVHTDPVLSRNLDFWGNHLKMNGIMCGDDYRGRFPDVRNGAHRKAAEMGRDLIVIENFWCLLPKPLRSKKLKSVRDQLLALAKEYRDEMEAMGPHARFDIVRATKVNERNSLYFDIELTQLGVIPWPSSPARRPLTITLKLIDKATDRIVMSFDAEMPVSQLECDIKHSLNLECASSALQELDDLSLYGEVIIAGDKDEAEFKLSIGKVDLAAVSGAPTATSGTTISAPLGLELAKKTLIDVKTDLSSREFFLQFSRRPNSIGVEAVSNSVYLLERPNGSHHEIRSMLSTHEIALCYALAALKWNGDAIVDLGPSMGASSWAFAKGISDAGHECKKPPIHSFDLWSSSAGYVDYVSQFPIGGAASILGQWSRTVEGYHHLFEPHQGDFLDYTWDGRPIGILFVNLAKSVELNNHLVRTMFPCLKPGAILIQQDYVHFNEYWIHLEMCRLRDYFEPCYTLRGATQFYRCIKSVPRDVANVSASELSYEEQVELLERERATALPPVQEAMKCAAAKHALDFGDLDRAHMLLSSVSVDPLTENGVQEFSGVARSNKRVVEDLLKKAKLSAHPSMALR